MKTRIQKLIPGLIGMAVQTNVVYYREMYAAAAFLGGVEESLHSMMTTINFSLCVDAFRAADWSGFSNQLADAARSLERGGAGFIVITSNTGHTAAEAIREAIALPVLDIVDETCLHLDARKFRKVGLLATSRTYQSRMYPRAAEGSIEFVELSPTLSGKVDQVILNELIFGKVSKEGLDVLGSAMQSQVEKGAECIVLACTDLTLIRAQLGELQPLPIVDTTQIHSMAAARMSFEGY
ncbi:aspartate/glutamate racemase family protein [Paraburkholderia sediminicola]|uniref:aspartate/glutamate racemase family protein n=1 Tax=Paraburkholderia sediminicola TaxID=458836 RepID=UPI0038B92DE2